jgi:outer membrane protein insertion porin family
MPVESLTQNKIVNLAYNLSENEVAYLNRLEFRGNTFTKDKVIRREMILREGDRFSLAMFKDSLLRIKQLGLVDVDKDPDIKPDGEDVSKINATVNVKELQRNNVQFSAATAATRAFRRRQLFDGEFLGRRERRDHGSTGTGEEFAPACRSRIS